MKKIILIGILLISLLLIGGCAYIGEICSQFLPEVFCGVITCVFGEEGLQNMLNNQEVRNFLQEHPDAEITITLIPKSTILENPYTFSLELNTVPIAKDYIWLGLKDGDNALTVWVDADTKELSYTQFGVSEQSSYKKLPETDCNQIDDLCPEELEHFCDLLKYEYELCEEEEKTPAPPKEEEIKAITTPKAIKIPVVIDDDWGMKPKEEKEEPTGLSDADLAQIDRLKVACEKGSTNMCAVLKNRYGIETNVVK